MDARSLFLTANTTTVYVVLCIDVGDGPMVVRVPPRVLGPVDDADFRWVTDVGLTGPDKGCGRGLPVHSALATRERCRPPVTTHGNRAATECCCSIAPSRRETSRRQSPA